MPRIYQAERNDSGDGWTATYRLTRDGDDPAVVHVTCTGTAIAAAKAHGNRRALEAISDSGARLARRLTIGAQRGRGIVTIHVDFDPQDGTPRYRYEYQYDYERDDPTASS